MALLNLSFNSSKSGGAGESRTPDTQFRKPRDCVEPF
jgi:hypothetical protein